MIVAEQIRSKERLTMYILNIGLYIVDDEDLETLLNEIIKLPNFDV